MSVPGEGHNALNVSTNGCAAQLQQLSEDWKTITSYRLETGGGLVMYSDSM